MIELQKKELIEKIKSMGIKDNAVLNAMYIVNREEFVGDDMKRYAYENNALPISNDQTISQPYTVAFMTELLNVKKGDKILEIGTGSGYQAAILAQMGAEVYSIERIKPLFEEGKRNLEKQNYKVKMKCADGSIGWYEYSPFDGIIVTAASPSVPETLIEQLKIDGRLVIPVGDKFSQDMWCVRKYVDDKGNIKTDTKKYPSFRFVPLLGKEGWK